MSSTLSKVLWINLDRRADRARVQQKALEAAGAFTTGELLDATVGCLIVTPRAWNYICFFNQKGHKFQIPPQGLYFTVVFFIKVLPVMVEGIFVFGVEKREWADVVEPP